jgi:hypothetical protein
VRVRGLMMIRGMWRKKIGQIALLASLALMMTTAAVAQECAADSEVDAATYNALIQTAGNNLQLAKRGDGASLQQVAAPVLANSFDGVRASLTTLKDGLQGPMTVKHVYLLDATNLTGEPQFFCGIFNANGMTPNSASMTIQGLSAGKYALVVQTMAGTPTVMLSQILQQQGTQWKLAGWFLKQTQIDGHDWQWFWQQGTQNKNQNHPVLAYLYYQQTRDFLAPVSFINTTNLDRVSQAMQSIQSPELPTNGPVTFQNYKIVDMYPVIFNGKYDLVIKHEVADVSNTAATFQTNAALLKAWLTAHPEMRDAFKEIEAWAATPQGQRYETLLAVKDIH